MSESFDCGHPLTEANSAKVGKGRVTCRLCRLAWRKAHDITAQPRPPPSEPESSPAPGRLALRKFSFEDV